MSVYMNPKSSGQKKLAHTILVNIWGEQCDCDDCYRHSSMEIAAERESANSTFN